MLVVNGTQLVQEAMSRHKLAPTATAALGRTLLGAALLGAFRKEEEMIQIQVRASLLGVGRVYGAVCMLLPVPPTGDGLRAAGYPLSQLPGSLLPCCCTASLPAQSNHLLQFKGDGPLGGILAVADTKGQVRVMASADAPALQPLTCLLLCLVLGLVGQRAQLALSSLSAHTTPSNRVPTGEGQGGQPSSRPAAAARWQAGGGSSCWGR